LFLRTALSFNFFAVKTHPPPARLNGPELSCGGEQPPQGSMLRGRSDHRRQVSPTPRGEIVDGWFRQLERLVRAQLLLTS